MPARATARLLFITGTDTGVGKTVLTALLLAHLRARQVRALAIKPFCSGDRADVTLLRSLQGDELTADEINPFFFSEPLAPLAAARGRRAIPLERVVERVQKVAGRCECLLIEGIGGLLVPLGHNYSVLDVIARLRCEILVVARNQLGALNHTLLTVRALRSRLPLLRKSTTRLKVVLMQPRMPDASSASNPRLLARLLDPTPVWTLPYLGTRRHTPQAILAAANQTTLARILA